MKLKEFDFKLPRDEVRKKKIMFTSISVIALILIVTIVSTFAYYQSIENQNPINTSVGEFSSGDLILALTIDGVPSNTFPTKGSGYVANSVTCDKGATGVWNNSEWNIEVGNLTQSKTTCNISFITTPTLKDSILSQGGGASTILAKGNPAFNTVPTAATSGIYATNDNYGTSYYYRGLRTSLNNNLIFAGFQWKIVRINGDGSIRIIYNGTEAQFNSASTMNTTGTNTQAQTNMFNYDGSPRFVGYMYGSNSNSLAQAQTNTNNSAIKTYIDAWYVSNIETQGVAVTNKISDTLFCNDRSILSGNGFSPTETKYTGYMRHVDNANNPTPTLMCSQKNDRFTVSNTTMGNANLTYPVGLISADEVVYSGMTWNYYNSNQYLYTAQNFWTMTPSDYILENAVVFSVTSVGGFTRPLIGMNYGVRPVLNLTLESAVISGNGSAANPFRVDI